MLILCLNLEQAKEHRIKEYTFLKQNDLASAS